MPHRRPIVAGNWKMNTDRATALRLAKGIAQGTAELAEAAQIVLFPPFTYLDAIRSLPDTGHLDMGAQDVSPEPNGALTGEISVEMLRDLKLSHALVGHSERRHVIGETDELIRRKTHATLDGGLQCVLCIGETIDQREAGETDSTNDRQLTAALEGLDAAFYPRLTIAYEPIWAIGTGKTATPEDAQNAHAFIRGRLAEITGAEIASATRILYGGSVKPSNATELFSMPDIDGGLIGGASLDAESFIAIVKAAAEIDATAG